MSPLVAQNCMLIFILVSSVFAVRMINKKVDYEICSWRKYWAYSSITAMFMLGYSVSISIVFYCFYQKHKLPIKEMFRFYQQHPGLVLTVLFTIVYLPITIRALWQYKKTKQVGESVADTCRNMLNQSIKLSSIFPLSLLIYGAILASLNMVLLKDFSLFHAFLIIIVTMFFLAIPMIFIEKRINPFVSLDEDCGKIIVSSNYAIRKYSWLSILIFLGFAYFMILTIFHLKRVVLQLAHSGLFWT